jgi:hypothetical protein
MSLVGYFWLVMPGLLRGGVSTYQVSVESPGRVLSLAVM